jgi:hypothetical protein
MINIKLADDFYQIITENQVVKNSGILGSKKAILIFIILIDLFLSI